MAKKEWAPKARKRAGDQKEKDLQQE